MWHRFDQCAEPVVGLVPIGDAMATLNPLFGQGISVAAWQAALLREALSTQPSIKEVTMTCLESFAAPVRAAWELGEVVDAEVTLRGPEHVAAFTERLVTEAEMHRRYVAIWHLLEPASLLAELAPTSASRLLSEEQTWQ